MKFEDKLIRGKSVLSAGTGEEAARYNVWHILAGTVLVMLISVSIAVASRQNPVMMYASQYIAAGIVGLLVGYLAGCVPSVTILVIVFATTGRMMFRLLLGELGAWLSTEFFVRLLAWGAFVAAFFAAARLGAWMKGRRRERGGGRAG